MKRREFMGLLGGVAVAWPLAARAQPGVPVIGWVYIGSSAAIAKLVPVFRQGLKENGFVDGQNVTMEYRFAEFKYDRLPNLLADLIRRQVAVIVAPGNANAALAAKAATTTVPIVFSVGEDPVKLGLVASLSRPDGNATGVNFFVTELGSKGLGLLRELVPAVARVGVLVNPINPTNEGWAREITLTASAVGVQIDIVKVSDSREIDGAFATLIQHGARGLLIGPDSIFFNHRTQLTMLAARHTIPVVYSLREYVEAGGLMSYGTSLPDVYRQLGIYAGRILLKGAKPADLPVVQSTKFEFVINVTTAKALGLTIPPSLLARADEVIE